MSSGKRILYIGGGREALETLQKAKSLDLEVLYIQQKNKFNDMLLDYVDKVVLIDYRDNNVLIPIAKTLQTIFPFTCALSMSEDALVPAAHVRDALGLSGNSTKTVQLLKDKSLMRQKLNTLGISPVAARVGHTLEDIIAFGDTHGTPFVIKPTAEAGSFGVFRVDDTVQLKDIWRQIQALKISPFLLEEYLDGPEISVESFTFHGRHVILAVTDKRTLDAVEIGHSIPAQLDKETYDLVVNLVHTFLDAVTFAEGPAHTEIKLTHKGPRIVESHDRPGGDRINELVRLAYGVDMKEMTLGWPCGLVEPLETSPQIQGGSAIHFFTTREGIVQEVSGEDDVKHLEGVVELNIGVKRGDYVHRLRESYDRFGWVVARGTNVQEAINRCQEVDRTVQIRVDMGEA
ncbi:ATP-grasp domain-containing protein [Numidum massiliense]|uniref:ATP-grasp domain-containing protein n=1 Tax=Numidum massiliense TaxID=1522315 RepID=UPI0006D5ABEC|nr:ATP-grasp domain-containing protein [Numidum massiliense]